MRSGQLPLDDKWVTVRHPPPTGKEAADEGSPTLAFSKSLVPFPHSKWQIIMKTWDHHETSIAPG
jgi:hypothetical protein